MIRRLAIALMALLVASPAAAGPYADPARAAGIDAALEAVRSWPLARTRILNEALRLGARTECKAGTGAPPVACLIEVAAAHCAARPVEEQGDCRLIADLLVTNMLGAGELVDRARRIELMSRSDDFRAAMDAELDQRYAELAAELVLDRGASALSEPGPAIDAFCVARARTHAMAWQRCVAALVFYIGTTDRAEEP